MAYLVNNKVIIHPYFGPDAFKLAVQLNNTSHLTADITHFPEQTVLNCQNSGQ